MSGKGRACTRVDFHCHSDYSDATVSLEDLAERLSAAGVAFAALTDHDSVEGLEGFRERLTRRGIGFVTGVEVTTQLDGREAHLLGFGFDPRHAELLATLESLRLAKEPRFQSIAGTLRHRGDAAANAAPDGTIGTVEAIGLLHRAGGRAFLAHPLELEGEPDRLREVVERLAAGGLDGLEACYGRYDEGQRAELCSLASSLGLLASAGSDWHGSADGAPGVDMPDGLWKSFREAVCFQAAGASSPPAAVAPRPLGPGARGWGFFLRFVFPTALAIGLFVVALFAVLLPALEQSLLERKREMIRELTSVALGILEEAHGQELAGRLARGQAQREAAARVKALRYGREGKDYFWIQDLQPRMIMHPYRIDLDGQDVSGFTDPRGARVFVEFADLVRRQREGYVEYVWQWKDDPRRLVPKESYVKGFEPWGWVVGTGLYIEDVRQETARIEGHLVRISLAVTGFVALLLLFVVKQSRSLERERSEAEAGLRESTERYRSLVEASTEGTLLVTEGRCRYANPLMLELLGYAGRDLEFLDFADVVAEGAGNELTLANVRRVLQGEEPSSGFEGALRRRDGTSAECVLSLSRLPFGGSSGFILMARPVLALTGADGKAGSDRAHHLVLAAEGAAVGLFRARAARRAVVLAANPAAAALLAAGAKGSGDAAPTLASLFPDDKDFEEFMAQVRQEGRASRRLHLTSRDARARTVRLDATAARDAAGQIAFVDGVLDDVTHGERREAEREALLERLQSSLLFLHQPVRHLGRSVVACPLDTPVRKAASLMTAQGSSAVLVLSASGDPVGIVTDHSLRERVLAAGSSVDGPIYRIMSAPLVTVSEHGQMYEALRLMGERGIQHLAVVDDGGRVVSVIHGKELLQFQSYGAIVLSQEIAGAATAEDVVRSCRRVPGLAKALLDSGAHPHRVTRMVAAACDAATERFLSLAAAELGPAPVPFAFLAFGSQGRQEQTLFTDQDNGVVYGEPAEGFADAVRSYFAELGRRVCSGLDEAGYPYCRGKVMASNERWCQSLAAWKDQFTSWIVKAEPQELLDLCIFFDFRAVAGEARLAGELRRHVHAVVAEHPGFLPHFAQNALLFKPPLKIFGRVLMGGSGGDHPGRVDLKDAAMPLVSFARLYALRHGCDDCNTLDRLDELTGKGALSPTTRDEVAAAYDFLMRLRLRHQVAALVAGEAPDNAIDPRRLGPIEATMLDQSFAEVAAVQKKVSYDFLGGT